MSTNDYRSYLEEEEKPASHPAGRWLGGLILGLILGGIVGFVIGSGNPGGFFDDMQGSFAGEGVWVILTIIVIIGVAMLKNMGFRRNGFESSQTARRAVMIMVIATVLALGILGIIFFIGD